MAWYLSYESAGHLFIESSGTTHACK
uniref:Uncharacterized protein n=1 Tax=Lepeophtheirus salmonis TaxID=72036 RepID=A0A0K2U5Q7_LEPSM